MSVRVFTATRPRQLSEVVKVELHPDYSRESGTAKAGEAFDLGEVLAMITDAGADKGKLVQLDPAAGDGSQNAIGVSHVIVEAGASDIDGIVYTARGAVLSVSGLRFAAGVTDVQKAAALAQLTALGIIVRNY